MKKRGRLTVVVAALVITGLMVVAVPAMAAGFGRGMGSGSGSSVMATVAEILGMSQSDLAAQRRAGESLADIAAAKGIDEAQVIGAIVADRRAALDAAFKAGRISQAQADQALENIKTNVTAGIERTTFGRPANAGQCMGRGYGRGQGRGGACPFLQKGGEQASGQSDQ